MKSIIDILDIPKDINGIDKEYTYLDKKYVSIPNVVGMSLNEVKKELKGFEIKIEGNDKGKVLYQSPSNDTKIEEGGIVRIYMQ